MQSAPWDICLYHGNCPDGFAAALAVWLKYYGSVDYRPCTHGQPLPLQASAGGRLLFVDFAPKRAQLDELLASGAEITILDHHKTAEEDIAELMNEGKVRGVFDISKSGARLAWEHVHGSAEVPRLIEHVEDRDLWRFSLPHTKEVCAWLFSIPYRFDRWTRALTCLEDDLGYRRAIEQGEAIVRKQTKDIEEIVPAVKRYMAIAGYRVPVANLPYMWASEAAHLMAEGEFFAACYYDRGDGKRCFSLRSNSGFDVSEVARQFDGGGHAAAAGFEVPIGWEGDPPRPATPAT